MQPDTILINDIAYNLTELETLAWQLLVRGSAKGKDGFHTMCIATVNSDNEPTLRTVVLRKADEVVKKLFFHTDTRSRKFADLQQQKCLSALFYDPHRRIQMTLKTQVLTHIDNALAEQRWREIRLESRRCYMLENAPNTVTPAPSFGYNPRFLDVFPEENDSEPFRQFFAVVECRAVSLEFLFLHHKGNRKAFFEYENGVNTRQNWVIP
jgi:hypothetical protein